MTRSQGAAQVCESGTAMTRCEEDSAARSELASRHTIREHELRADGVRRTPSVGAFETDSCCRLSVHHRPSSHRPHLVPEFLTLQADGLGWPLEGKHTPSSDWTGAAIMATIPRNQGSQEILVPLVPRGARFQKCRVLQAGQSFGHLPYIIGMRSSSRAPETMWRERVVCPLRKPLPHASTACEQLASRNHGGRLLLLLHVSRPCQSHR